MSRSYRKNTFVVDRHGRNIRRKFFKKYYNRSLRNLMNKTGEIIQNSEYKKFSNSWNICDYRWYWSEKDAKDEYFRMLNNYIINPRTYEYFFKKYPTLESWMHKYKKQVLHK